MLKLAALLLLLVNLLLLAMHGGLLQAWLGRPTAAGQREPERMARQIRPDAVQLLPPANTEAPARGASTADSAATTSSAASAASAANSASMAAPGSAAAGSSAAAPAAPAVIAARPAAAFAALATACLEAGPFDGASAAAAERTLQQAGVAAGDWVLSAAAPAIAYLVYMGRYADQAALDRKRDELRQLAVPAYPVEASSGLQPGLSLGRHASAAAAQAAMAGLAQRGIHTARLVTVASSTAAGALLRLPAADAKLQARLAGLGLPGGPGFRPCADQRLAAAPIATSTATAAAASR